MALILGNVHWRGGGKEYQTCNLLQMTQDKTKHVYVERLNCKGSMVKY